MRSETREGGIQIARAVYHGTQRRGNGHLGSGNVLEFLKGNLTHIAVQGIIFARLPWSDLLELHDLEDASLTKSVASFLFFDACF